MKSYTFKGFEIKILPSSFLLLPYFSLLFIIINKTLLDNISCCLFWKSQIFEI